MACLANVRVLFTLTISERPRTLLARCLKSSPGAAAATAISQACACALLLIELNGKRGNRAPSTIEAPSAKEGNLLGTSLALLLRSTCQLGTDGKHCS